MFKDFLGTVEELLSELFEDIPVFIEENEVSHIIEPEDIDDISEELSSREVLEYKFIPNKLLIIKI